MRWISIVVFTAACSGQVAGGSTDGAKVFAAACARCHGEHGRPPQQMVDQLGVRDLTGAEWKGRRALATIEHQAPGRRQRPHAYVHRRATDAQIKAVAAYVMTME
jgi:mono/diheme cytochrome c family protein